MNKNKIFTLIMSFFLMCSVLVGCGGTPDGDETSNTSTTSSTGSSTSETEDDISSNEQDETGTTESKNETHSNDGTTIATVGGKNWGIVSYDEKYKDLKELSSFSISVNVIPFPSTKTPSENMIKEIKSEADFKGVLEEYSDLQNNENDSLTFEEENFAYTHEFSNYMSSGYKNTFFLLGSPDFDPLKQMDCEDIYYDENTKTAYVALELGSEHSQYEMSDSVKEKIDSNSKATYGIIYYHLGEDYEDMVENILFIMPEK